ncbi:MAG: hypothetical protein GXO12_06215 [Epsilonproteobacteria bacterium]|nr:hypothetical protein [Campylobacterota bacterium]
MRVENFIYFFTICGFFIGLVFSIINFNEPEYILFYTAIITLFFYLLIHVAIAGFLDVQTISKNIFNKAKYEEVSEYFIYEMEIRERKIDSLVNIVEDVQNKEKINNSVMKEKHDDYNKIAA